MKILISPDKFKECLPARDVAMHICKGILHAMPHADCKILPMADGGEGTVDVLTEATQGRIENVIVHDPLMRRIGSFYGISGDGKTAFIEMAAASGLALLKRHERNPLVATSYGTGELIQCALGKGCREIIIGIGGSATVDAGVGMAQALGIKFRDEFGQEISAGGGSLNRIKHIDMAAIDSGLKDCIIYAACDVTNPLSGSTGAALVFSSQKGATLLMANQLDANLKHLSLVILAELGIDVDDIPGAGAAGGMGAGVMAFLNGKLKPGFDIISRIAELEKWIRWSDIVITGEGKMDAQTGYGKTPAGVAAMAVRNNKPVIAFTGALAGNLEAISKPGFNAVIPITDRPMTLKQSIKEAGILIENAAKRTMGLLCLIPSPHEQEDVIQQHGQ